MNPLPSLRGLAEKIGGPGVAAVLGGACLLAALGLQASVGSGLAQQRDALRAQLDAQRDRLRLNGGAGPSRDESASAQLIRFYAGFPAANTSAYWLARIQAAARRSGIALPTGEYRLEQRSAERLQRYTIVLPVRASYAQVRGFLDTVLSDIPSAALDGIDMRRESAASPVLDARIRLTLYLNADAATAAGDALKATGSTGTVTAVTPVKATR